MSEYSRPFPADEPNQTESAPADDQHGKTISVRKLIANRRNAKKSTGPRSPRGKAHSSRNALKHGLFARPRMEFALLGEDASQYEELKTALSAEYKPLGVLEELEVEQILECWWNLRRAKRYETALARTAVRDFGREEIWRQLEHSMPRDVADDQLILMLQEVENKIAATGRVPDGFNEKLGAMRPALGSVWPLFERTADEELRKLCEPGQHPWKFSPDEYSAQRTWLTVIGVIEFLKQQQTFRITNSREIAIAERIIPDGPRLDGLLRYRAATERSLARAQDRLAKLQEQRNVDPVTAPRTISVAGNFEPIHETKDSAPSSKVG